MASLNFHINGKNSSIYKIILQNHINIVFLLCCKLTFNHTTKKNIPKCHYGLQGCSIRATIPPEPLPRPQIFHKLKKKSLRSRPTECDPRLGDYNPIFFFSKLYRIKEPIRNCLFTKSTDNRNCIYFVLAPRISKYYFK